jgi:hypothetical protein
MTEYTTSSKFTTLIAYVQWNVVGCAYRERTGGGRILILINYSRSATTLRTVGPLSKALPGSWSHPYITMVRPSKPVLG